MTDADFIRLMKLPKPDLIAIIRESESLQAGLQETIEELKRELEEYENDK